MCGRNSQDLLQVSAYLQTVRLLVWGENGLSDPEREPISARQGMRCEGGWERLAGYGR